MRRLMLLTAGVALAAVPAVFGLTDNPSFSHSVPVRIPAGAVRVTDAPTGDDGQLRHGGGHGSSVQGHGSGIDGHGSGGGASAIPNRSGKDHGVGPTPEVSGKDHGAAPVPEVSGKDDGAARTPKVSGKDHGPAPTPKVSGKDHGVVGTPQMSGKDGQDDAAAPNAPTVGPSPGKVRGPAVVPDEARVFAAPDQRARRPGEPRTGGGRGNSQAVDDLSRGGGSGQKLSF